MFFRNTENEPTTPSPPARLQQAEYVLLLIHFVTKTFLTMHKILWLSGLGQTSNVSWDRPNSDLGRPKLSLDRRLGGQTSNLGRVEPINCLRPKKQF